MIFYGLSNNSNLSASFWEFWGHVYLTNYFLFGSSEEARELAFPELTWLRTENPQVAETSKFGYGYLKADYIAMSHLSQMVYK